MTVRYIHSGKCIYEENLIETCCVPNDILAVGLDKRKGWLETPTGARWFSDQSNKPYFEDQE